MLIIRNKQKIAINYLLIFTLLTISKVILFKDSFKVAAFKQYQAKKKPFPLF